MWHFRESGDEHFWLCTGGSSIGTFYIMCSWNTRIGGLEIGGRVSPGVDFWSSTNYFGHFFRKRERNKNTTIMLVILLRQKKVSHLSMECRWGGPLYSWCTIETFVDHGHAWAGDSTSPRHDLPLLSLDVARWLMEYYHRSAERTLGEGGLAARGQPRAH